MKKLFFFCVMLFGILMCQEAKANSTNYYAKVTVDVAEDSKGLGTVYILNEQDEEVMESTGMGVESGGLNDGANVGFIIMNTPADGYVLLNFTDQNGNIYTYPSASSFDNPHIISVYATSTDEADPTVFNLSAHFVLESELPKGELAEVTVSPEMKYGTFICPVAAEIPDDMQAYRITGVTDEAVILETINYDEIDPFTPVLLENIGLFDATISATYEPSELPEELPSLTDGLLTGVLEETMAPEGSYVVEPLISEEGSGFVRVETDNVFVKPYTCYMTVENSTKEAYKIGQLTGITELLNEGAKVQIYDMEGRKLNGLHKGVNIVGNTKIIVK